MQKSSSDFGPITIVKNNAIISAILVVTMLIVFILLGIGQDPLQYVHSIKDYQTILTNNPSILKFAIGLDNAFILFYLTMFLSLTIVLSKLSRLNLLGKVAMLLIFATAIFDILENMHFLTMIASAKENFIITENEMKVQVWESLVKFHLSYVGFYLLSFVLPTTTTKEKILCFLLRWVQWPIGILIYITPTTIAKPLVLLRFAFFLTALILLAMINFKQYLGNQQLNELGETTDH